MSYKAQLIELRRHPYHAFRPPHSRKAWKPWKPRKPNKRIVFRCFFEISFCFYSALCFISATFLILFLFLSLFADVFASAADASYKCILVSSPLSPFHCHYPNTAKWAAGITIATVKYELVAETWEWRSELMGFSCSWWFFAGNQLHKKVKTKALRIKSLRPPSTETEVLCYYTA